MQLGRPKINFVNGGHQTLDTSHVLRLGHSNNRIVARCETIRIGELAIFLLDPYCNTMKCLGDELKCD